MEQTQSQSGFLQRLNQAIMCAMQALRQSGQGSQMGYPQMSQGFGAGFGRGPWGQQQQFEQTGTEQLANAIHEQTRQALRDRLTAAGRERIAEAIKDGLRETLRERLSFALRNAMAEAHYGPQGFDPNRVAYVLRERLSSVIERRTVEVVRERFVALSGEQLDDVIRTALTQVCSRAGFGMTGERDIDDTIYELREQLLEGLRHGLEERLCEHLHDIVRESVQQAVRARLANALQEALAQGGYGSYGRLDIERVCAVLEDRLSEAIREHVADAVRDPVADAIREQVEEVLRERLRKTLYNVIGPRLQNLCGNPQGMGSFGNPQGMGSFGNLQGLDSFGNLQGLDSFGGDMDPDRLADNVAERLTDAIHECITQGLRQRIKDALRSREAIRNALFQGQGGGRYGTGRQSPLSMY